MQTVFAQARQVHHEDPLKAQQGFGLQASKVGIVQPGDMCTREVALPIGPGGGGHGLSGDGGYRFSLWLMARGAALGQVCVVVGPRLVILLHARLGRIAEERRQPSQLASARQHRAVLTQFPA